MKIMEMLKTKIDGQYSIPADFLKSMPKSIFKKESEFCDMIEGTIEKFTSYVLGHEYLSHEREFYFYSPSINLKTGNFPRADFCIRTKAGKTIILECKNPRHTFSELMGAVSQILYYSVLLEKRKVFNYELIIVTTFADYRIRQVIDRYNLPIRLCIVSEDFTLITP